MVIVYMAQIHLILILYKDIHLLLMAMLYHGLQAVHPTNMLMQVSAESMKDLPLAVTPIVGKQEFTNFLMLLKILYQKILEIFLLVEEKQREFKHNANKHYKSNKSN